jgi:hypothetical protein
MTTATTTILHSDIDALTFELACKAPAQSKPAQYVNNKELQAEFLKYWDIKQKWLEEGKGVPPLTHKIGQAIIDISTRRTYSRNFVGYTQAWKEEMIGDAIETCARYAHNYNPVKYSNPFAYITQLVTNAIILRIKREKLHTYIKFKTYDNAHGFSGLLDDNISEDDLQLMDETTDMYRDHLTYIADFESRYMTKPEKVAVDTGDLGVLEFLS